MSSYSHMATQNTSIFMRKSWIPKLGRILIFGKYTPETCFQLDSGKNSILANFLRSTARSVSKFEYETPKLRGKLSYGVRVMSKTVRKPSRWWVFRVATFPESQPLEGRIFFWNIDIFLKYRHIGYNILKCVSGSPLGSTHMLKCVKGSPPYRSNHLKCAPSNQPFQNGASKPP